MSPDPNVHGNVITVSAIGNRFLFTGREWLKELGLYDYRNRIYSVELGRFLQTDPTRLMAGDINIHRYVMNRVINYRDCYGLEPFGAGGSPENKKTLSECMGISDAEVFRMNSENEEMLKAFEGVMKEMMLSTLPVSNLKGLSALAKDLPCITSQQLLDQWYAKVLARINPVDLFTDQAMEKTKEKIREIYEAKKKQLQEEEIKCCKPKCWWWPF